MSGDLPYGLTLTLMGLGIVFLVLLIITLLIVFIRRMDDRWQERERLQDLRRLDRPPTIDAITAVLIASAAPAPGRPVQPLVGRRTGHPPGISCHLPQTGSTRLGRGVIERRRGNGGEAAATFLRPRGVPEANAPVESVIRGI